MRWPDEARYEFPNDHENGNDACSCTRVECFGSLASASGDPAGSGPETRACEYSDPRDALQRREERGAGGRDPSLFDPSCAGREYRRLFFLTDRRDRCLERHVYALRGGKCVDLRRQYRRCCMPRNGADPDSDTGDTDLLRGRLSSVAAAPGFFCRRDHCIFDDPDRKSTRPFWK